MPEPVCLWDARCMLGEGPCWDPRSGELLFVDIKEAAVHRLRLADGRRLTARPSARVTAIGPRAAGGFVASSDRGFATLDLDAGTIAPIAHPEPDRPTNRFNDGKLDTRGAWWAGTMDDLETHATGALYRLRGDGGWARMDDGYRVTNGPAFSPDGRRMYHTDSGRKMIYLFELDAGGQPGPRLEFAQFHNRDGSPDGMTVDTGGDLWVAFWDGWVVRRLSPAGQVHGEHAMPVQRPTSLCFGGEALDRLFVTSARIGLNADALAAQPLAGGLFEIANPGAHGSAVPAFPG